MQQTPFISIIIPVYNAEKTLDRCIESALSQTFINFELILVNDGSQDESGCICDQYATKDSRVKVFHKPNGGVSSARNVGLQHAEAKYVCFMDSDDWVEENYQALFFLGNSDPEQTLIIQNFYFEWESTSCSVDNFIAATYTKSKFSDLFIDFQILKHGYLFGKLFTLTAIRDNGISFDEKINFKEDHLFLLQYLPYVDSVTTVNRCSYHYSITPNSLCKVQRPFETEIYIYNTLKETLREQAVKLNLNKQSIAIWTNDNASMLGFALRSIYRFPYKKPRAERLKILKDLYTEENIASLRGYMKYNLTKISDKLPIHLYCKKWFLIFDFCYLCFCKWKNR